MSRVHLCDSDRAACLVITGLREASSQFRSAVCCCIAFEPGHCCLIEQTFLGEHSPRETRHQFSNELSNYFWHEFWSDFFPKWMLSLIDNYLRRNIFTSTVTYSTRVLQCFSTIPHFEAWYFGGDDGTWHGRWYGRYYGRWYDRW